MAVVKKRTKAKGTVFDLNAFVAWMKTLLLDPSKTWIVAITLLLAEILVNMVVIWKVKCKYDVQFENNKSQREESLEDFLENFEAFNRFFDVMFSKVVDLTGPILNVFYFNLKRGTVK